MTPQRWKQIDATLAQALEMPAEARSAFLAQHCAGDDALRHEVESLLASHKRAGIFLDDRTSFSESVKEAVGNPGPQMIGPWRIVRELGHGGMGTVYLAERADEQYEQQVAIKLIKRGMDSDTVLRHFRNERQILAGFDHPNIARLFDGGTTSDGQPYFVMEYVAGLRIDEYCERHRLSIAERLKIFREVCSAVSYAHRHLVIHRDLKRSNILVTAEGCPKLLDFGIAKLLQAGDDAQSATVTGLRLLTPEYASPEQLRGEAVTTASDVYSLGVVLYELLTAHSPYRLATATSREIERAVIEQIPQKPSTTILDGECSEFRNPKVLRGDLDNIVLMALRKEPARRYPSVEQFSEDLRRHLATRPVVARADTIGYRTGKFLRRNRIALTAAGLVYLTLVGGIGAIVFEANRARKEKVRAERRFNDVRQLAHSVLFDYHDAIKNLPGATKVRARLVSDALRYLDGLNLEAGGEPELQRELAAAYMRVGDVRGERYSANLGDSAGAMESYRKAQRIREALVTAAGTVQDRSDLALTYEKIGSELLEEQPVQSLDYFHKMLAIYQQLAAEQPGHFRAELAEAYGSVGSALEYSGNMAGALAEHRKALALRAQLVANSPADRAARFRLADSYKMIGRALFQTNAPAAAALENNSKALALRKALVTEDPANTRYRRELAIDWQNDGDYRAEGLKDLRGGLASFRKKLAIEEELLAEDPANALTCGDWGYSNLRIGDLLLALGNYSDAIPYYRHALASYEQEAAALPAHGELAERTTSVRIHLAEAEARANDFASARADCAKAAAQLRATIAKTARVAERDIRANNLVDLGESYAALAADKTASPEARRNDWRVAHDMYRSGLEVFEKLRATNDLSAYEIAQMAEISEKISKSGALAEP